MKKFEVNGMEVVDRMLREHGVIGADEVWVHGMWTIGKWAKCLKAKLSGKKLVRMTHGSLSPIYLERQGKWKKRLVKPIEKLLFRLADRIVFTGEWEAQWFKAWMKGQEAKFEVVDLKRYFRLGFGTQGEVLTQVPDGTRKVGRDLNAKPEVVSPERSESQSDALAGVQTASRPTVSPLHVLYLGRRHPLKGVEFLEQAIKELNSVVQPSNSNLQPRFALRIVSDHTGEELEKDWEWCDVLCLPTLSENFGLVVAEALERGKRVITTDGAPAWAPEEKIEGGRLEVEQWRERLFYIKGYRDGSDETRVKLLTEAIKMFANYIFRSDLIV